MSCPACAEGYIYIYIYIYGRVEFTRDLLSKSHKLYRGFIVHPMYVVHTIGFQTFFVQAFKIGPAVRVFANGPGDLGSIPGRVIPKTLKMELDTTLLNTQHYKVRFKGKVEQSREWSSAFPLYLGVVAIEKGAFGSPSTMVANFTYYCYTS